MTRARVTEDFQLRPATSEDEPFLRDLYASAHGESLAAVPLPPEQKAALLTMQLRAQRQHYASRHPAAEDHVVLVEGERVGRLWLDRRADALHVLDIALLPAFRGTGLGSAVLRWVQNDSAEKGLAVTLHAAPGSRAVALYLRLGFREVGSDGASVWMEWRR